MGRHKYVEVDLNKQQDLAVLSSFKKKLKAMTTGQQDYIDAINECKIVACTGPAGTGKSFIPCAMAVQYLLEGKVDKIILVRPIVECGSGLGFLPGDIKEKTAVYMNPFFDAFSDFLSKKEISDFEEKEKIIVSPLEYMRGLTFKRSFVILDEAQNCTYKQLKLLLTRYGEGTKMVINGDSSQSDLDDKNNYSDFDYACDLLLEIDDKDIDVVTLTEDDIVRHGIIRKILRKFT